ncbi:TIGR01212 family radical SAM protein [Niameybacter massiliensis]|uniref:TIGR01212 family radical SAM protein n=1 Tax=Holtiella tumoricola TaxID=3018743 RepID=A0AA42DR30_9FIRM|nr:TIGR01212 family radical SAM protein [Holtiella tumoricola]MDA3733675.1 TIGR01212 family radical SAM protein [Holtiella tumoricola]
MAYRRYADTLKEKYGEKVYKIPVNLPVTCPNRDGNCGTGGCTFCSEVGIGYELLDTKIHIQDQLKQNIDYIGKRYKAHKFIAYLQNFSNTYMPLEQFKGVLDQIKYDGLVGISISTRPDCIHEDYLVAIKEWQDETGYDVCIELGLQTMNYHTLKQINRGHGLSEYLDAVLRIKRYGFEICTHLILNLPWDNMDDVIENAKLMSVLEIDYIKLHALYITKNTKMGRQYEAGEFEMISKEEYEERVITFLRYLSDKVVVQRIIGRAPEEYTLFANWNTSWWKIHDEIIAKMGEEGFVQGDLCHYQNGRALQRFMTKEEA